MTAKKTAAAETANERPVAHYVLYADGFPVHSSDDLDECNAEKLNAGYDARRGGKPTPKFHIVKRDFPKGAKVSHDSIVEGDEENIPAGVTIGGE